MPRQKPYKFGRRKASGGNDDREFPWMMFFPSDHRAEASLRICSLAARGLWTEMLCLMHEANNYGHLEINNKPILPAQLAQLVGVDEETVTVLLQELENNGVFSRNKDGTIYSRRMVRDEKKRRLAQENGKRGGNPSLCKEKRNSASDNLEDKDGLKLQSPDTRNQSPETLVSGDDPEWKKEMLKAVGAIEYNSWIRLLEYEGNGTILCPSGFVMSWVKSHYRAILEKILKVKDLNFTIASDENKKTLDNNNERSSS